MVLEGLGESLRKTLKRIATSPYIDKDMIEEIVRELQRALLQADVNARLVVDMTGRVKERALSEKPKPGRSHKEQVIKIIYEELSSIIGEGRSLPVKKQVILLVGLYGQGKTTTAAKLAKFFFKKGMKPGLIAADVHRPAAYNQLKKLGDDNNIPVHGEPGEKNAVKIVKRGLVNLEKCDVIIIDSAGRHSLDSDLIKEIEHIAAVAKPDHRILVIDATTGQQAGPQAEAFHNAVHVNGVIISKMDGSARGGGALSAVAKTAAPIMFIGTGEHVEDLERFEKNRFISRLLGMGDIESLLESFEENVDMEDAEEFGKKALSGKMNLKDMYEYLKMINKMGPLSKVMGMIPGAAKMIKKPDADETQNKLKTFRIIMDSMTDEEMENPKIIKNKRITRIARGSGVSNTDVKALLKYYEQTRSTIKGVMGNRKARGMMMKQLEGMDLESML